MFHTAEIRCELSKDKYNDLAKRGHTDSKSKNRWQITNRNLNEYGISKIQVWKKTENDFPCYYIQCVVNLPKLATYGARTSYVNLSTEKDIPSIKEAFAILIQDFSPALPQNIDDWTLNRLDYAVNLDIGHTLSRLYPALLNRGKPRGRTIDRDEHDSSYSYGNDSWDYNLYSKGKEAERTEDDPYSIWDRRGLTDIEKIRYQMEADGVFRVEAQYKKRKLYRSIKSHDAGQKRTLSALAKNDIALKELSRAVAYISPPNAPYRSRKETEKRIRSTSHREATKEKMLDCVDQISRARSHSRIAELYTEYKDIVRLMLKDGINPVAMRDSEIKELRKIDRSSYGTTKVYWTDDELEPLCRVLERQIALVEMWKD